MTESRFCEVRAQRPTICRIKGLFVDSPRYGPAGVAGRRGFENEYRRQRNEGACLSYGGGPAAILSVGGA